MIWFIVGLISGMLVGILVLVSAVWYEVRVLQRGLHQHYSGDEPPPSLSLFGKREKAEIFPVMDDETDAIAEVIQDNEARGRDTKMDEL